MSDESADIVLINGKIITVDGADMTAEAVAVKGGKILKVGTTKEIRRLVNSKTKEIDLKGRTVTPGFVDCHLHHVTYGFSDKVLNLRYPKVKSIEEIKRLVKEASDKIPPGEWIRGKGWDEAVLEERRSPTRHDLDPVSSENPVVLSSQLGFSVVNTFAIKLAGVEADKEEQDGILRFSRPLSRKIYSLSQLHTVGEVENAIMKAQRGLFRVGVTAVKDAGTTVMEIEAFKNLHKRGELKIRSYLMYEIFGGTTSIERAQEAVAYSKPYGDDVLALKSVKCSFDGLGGSREAWLYEEYKKNFTERDEFNYGGPIVAKPYLHGEVIKILHRAGFQVGTHCEGDQTIDRYLNEIEAAITDTPRTNCRHSVIHCDLPTDYALRKLVELGDNVVVETNPCYMYFTGDLYAGNLGPSRSRRMMPLRTLLDRGIVVGVGSDFSDCLEDPLYGIYAACTRRPSKGVYGPQPFGTDECLTVQQTLRLYTINSAYCMFWEDKIGSLEPGKYADLVVWSGDMYSVPIDEILDLKVEMTLVGGEIVHSA